MKHNLKNLVIKELSLVDNPANQGARVTIYKRKDDDMSDDNKAQAEQVELLTKQLKDAEKALKDAQEVAKMSDDEKEYMKGLSEKQREEFMAMGADERKKKLSKSSDEVLKVGSQIIRKSSVGDDVFAVMKSQQEAIEAQREAVEKANAKAEMVELTKFASENYAHVVGTDESIALVLKAKKAMDSDTAAALDAILKSAESMAASAFFQNGVKVNTVAKSAEDSIDSRAKEIAKSQNVSYEIAYTKALEENPDLYTQMN